MNAVVCPRCAGALAGAVVLLAAALAAATPPDDAPLPGWAHDYHTLLSGSTAKRGREWELGIMAERGAWATGWYGAWWIQNNVERLGRYDSLKHVEYFRRQGVKNEFYFDAGEMGEFVALVDDGRIRFTQWEFPWYQNQPGQLMWFGKDAFYRDRNPLRLKNYRDFGLPPWTFPDGTRVESVYQLARTSFDGRTDRWVYSHVRAPEPVAQSLHIDEFLARGPDPVPPEAGHSLGRIRSYDHSNPFLLGDFQAGVGMMLGQKPAFLHFDNYFDNELVYPRWGAFGPWSLENFRRFARQRLDAATRQRLGLADLERFDLKAYIRGRPYGDPRTPAFFRDPRWHDDPLWNLFVCSKLADADKLFRGLYAFSKRESRRQGAEVIVASNVIPLFPGGSLVSGALDVAHFEHVPARQYGPIVVPTGLPPLGRLGGVCRIGAAVSKAGYCWLSAYVPKSLGGPGHENLHRVMAFDCLANRAVLDYNFQYLDGYTPGSDVSAAWIDCFIKNYAHDYGSRVPLRNTLLVFPGQSLLGNIDVFCMDPRPSLYDYLGWAQALTELHVAWDALPDDQLSDAALAGCRLVILPGCACLGDRACAALAGFARSGGRLILSGPAGERFGPEHFLWHRPAEQTLLARLGPEPSVAAGAKPGPRRYILSPAAWGRTFYEDVAQGRRNRGRAEIRGLVDQALAGVPPLAACGDRPLLGLSVCRQAGRSLAVDLMNYDLDPTTDRLVPARNVQLVLRPPAGERFLSAAATMISPELRTAADPQAVPRGPTPWRYARRTLAGTLRGDGSVVVAVPEFLVFCTVVVPLGAL